VKIAVMGAGAMGALYGALLAEGGNEVTLVDAWQEHVQAIMEHGLQVETGGCLKTFSVKAVSDPLLLGVQDLVLIFVKSYHTEVVVKNIHHLFHDGTAVLTLQNGLGNADIIAAAFNKATVLVGTTSHGATVLGPGQIRHAGAGDTVVGKYSGKIDQHLSDIAAEFTRCHLNARTDDNIMGVIWGKLLINAGINPVTAICGVLNGELLKAENIRQMAKLLIDEGEAVARASGIELPYNDTFAVLEKVAAATAANRSSMLQDIMSGRATEIDYINGAVVKEGEKCGVPTPCNKFITRLIKELEQRGSDRC